MMEQIVELLKENWDDERACVRIKHCGIWIDIHHIASPTLLNWAWTIGKETERGYNVPYGRLFCEGYADQKTPAIYAAAAAAQFYLTA